MDSYEERRQIEGLLFGGIAFPSRQSLATVCGAMFGTLSQRCYDLTIGVDPQNAKTVCIGLRAPR